MSVVISIARESSRDTRSGVLSCADSTAEQAPHRSHLSGPPFCPAAQHGLGAVPLLDERVGEDAADADEAAEHLHRLQALTEGEGRADDDDDALGRVGDAL
eukprot:CAMPEP_0118829434 /NCGR_PEP_ID=MMETSP1162-20130426/23090_1 /TAXON_ID=33656 /ORGANISM="Phaeocystis Sp, Strain CCMP2710" /LENGTH=100 /DNA_ID=CAMNT_0006760611 /DNA_START=92 /DNA_END=391 /DNA_ORIENTATION=-